MRPLALEGRRFGRLVVVARGTNRGRKVMWVCRCDCGQQSVAQTADLTAGKHRSCGCLQLDTVTFHGATHHGGGKSPEYLSWGGMKQRCLNPRSAKYAYYGGRGITIYDRWRDSFEAFLADMGPRPGPGYSIDRLDPDGNYEPGNCRWATRAEQRANQRPVSRR